MQLKRALLTTPWRVVVLLMLGSTTAYAERRALDCVTPPRLELRATKSDTEIVGRFRGHDRRFDELLRELSKESARCGGNRSVDVLVSDRYRLSMLNELRGLLSKAGLTSGRYYIVNSRTGKMVEITFGRVEPYTEKQ